MTETNRHMSGVDAREYEEQHYGILVEAMVDQGCSEDEIVQAIEQATAPAKAA